MFQDSNSAYLQWLDKGLSGVENNIDGESSDPREIHLLDRRRVSQWGSLNDKIPKSLTNMILFS